MYQRLKVVLFGWIIIGFCLSGCVSKAPSSDKVFSNAQVLYQVKGKESPAKRTYTEKASYFIELNYEPEQTTLSNAQIKKIDSVFEKLIYPEEYKLYVSFGGANADNQLAGLTPMLKRAQDLKAKYGKKVSAIQVAYLKNQKPNIAFIRLMA